VANAQTLAEGTSDPAEALAQRERFQAECQRLRADGKLAEAIAAAEGKLAIERKLKGDHLEEILGSLQWIAEVEAERGNFEKAIERRREALEILRRVRGASHWSTLDASQAVTDAEHRAKMKPEHRQRLAEADRLESRATSLYFSNHFGEAETLARQVVAIRKDLLGTNHPVTAKSIHDLATILLYQGDYAGAKRLHEEALAILKEVLGPKHPDTATSLSNLASLLNSQGNYAGARPLVEEALAIRKEVLGPKHPDTANSLNDLAWLLKSQGDFTRTKPLFEEVLAIRKATLGARHPDTATALNNLGLSLQWQGDYAGARLLLEEALAIRKEVLGPKHPDTANSLSNLASLLNSQGDYAEARKLFEEALAILEAMPGPRHSYTASILNDLGWLLLSQGDYTGARPLFEEALAIRKATLGARHPDTASCMSSLGVSLLVQGDYAKARPLFEEALAILKATLGPTHPETANSLNTLAGLLLSQEDFTAARPLLEESQAICKVSLGPRHPDNANSLNNLALLRQWQGDYAEARPLFEEALAICKEALGPTHPDTATCLSNLGSLLIQQGNHTEGSQLLARASGLNQQNLELAASSQSERQQLRMAESLTFSLNGLLSVSERSGISSGRLYGFALGIKGSVLARQRLARMWRKGLTPGTAVANDLAELRSVVVRLSTLAFNPSASTATPARLEEMTRLTTTKERLEVRLAATGPEFEAARASLSRTAEQIQTLVARDSALVDILEYTHYDPAAKVPGKIKGERRMLAFVVRPDQPVAMIHLGPLEPISRTVEAWRVSILSKEPPRGDDPARRLRDLVWTPLESHLDGVGTILFSPDGPLDRVPFGALPGKDLGTYLIEDHAIALVPVPRMLGLARRAGAGGIGLPRGNELSPSLLAIGDVDYGADPGQSAASGSQRSAAGRSRDGHIKWPELKGTGTEIKAIARSFQERFRLTPSDTLSGAAATEEAFRQSAPKHRYLHLATHGYFAPQELKSALDQSNTSANRLAIDRLGGAGLVGYNPGLLSGLVLAGANRRTTDSGKDDGILTALEVAELDLSGVELAVLSACETGLGEVAGGEGLLGLQRAFQVAGARSVVASLWSVGDDATRDLMTRFYRNLWQKGLKPAEALRGAQLEMIKEIRHGETKKRGLDPDQRDEDRWRASPCFWAAFVVSTDEP